MSKILVADDDYEIVDLIADSLFDEGFQVLKAHSGKEVLDILKKDRISLLILDIMMPEMDGFEVCRRVRDEISVPIIFLSAKSREMDKIIGLEIGADDYITKPFSINELCSRVKAHLRRERRSEASDTYEFNIIRISNLLINKDTFDVHKDNVKIDLSTKEFQLLVYFAENKNRVLTREQIYNAVWGNFDSGDVNTVTVHIKNLRDKMDKNNEFIKTVWGIGYKFSGGEI